MQLNPRNSLQTTVSSQEHTHLGIKKHACLHANDVMLISFYNIYFCVFKTFVIFGCAMKNAPIVRSHTDLSGR